MVTVRPGPGRGRAASPGLRDGGPGPITKPLWLATPGSTVRSDGGPRWAPSSAAPLGPASVGPSDSGRPAGPGLGGKPPRLSFLAPSGTARLIHTVRPPGLLPVIKFNLVNYSPDCPRTDF